jgi:transposase
VERRKNGSKHHLATDAGGAPLTARLIGANRNDVTQLIALVDSLPPVRGVPGAPLTKPAQVVADRGYDSDGHRMTLSGRGIRTAIARRNIPHGSGLGVLRWVVERTLSWLHQARRLRVRYESVPTCTRRSSSCAAA